MAEENQVDKDGLAFERRKFVRVNGTYVVSYFDVTSMEVKRDITQTRNISAGGLLFTTDREFPSGTILKIKLRLPDAPDYINIKVHVIESRKLVKGMLYDTRAKFIGIREEDRGYINKVVQYSLREKNK